MIKAKYINTVENLRVTELLFNNDDNLRINLEIPNVVKDIKQFDVDTLRNKVQDFMKLYSEFIKIFGENHGGMSCVDLFSFWYTVDIMKPKIVIESGVFQGGSTWFIRKTVPNAKLFCFDPMVPQYIDKTKDSNGNDLALYFVGEKFKDFKDVNLLDYGVTKSQLSDECLAFFDCHTNGIERLIQSSKLGIKHVLLNDNYPEGCGGHLTLEHIKSETDNRFSTPEERKKYCNFMTSNIIRKIIFPNIVGDRVQTGEGTFTVDCLFKDFNEMENILYNTSPEPEHLELFKEQSLRYRWNTYVKLR